MPTHGMGNDIRSLAVMLDALPVVDVLLDPYDNYLLALAEAGQADVLVTGDKCDVLVLSRHRGTRIVTAWDARRSLPSETGAVPTMAGPSSFLPVVPEAGRLLTAAAYQRLADVSPRLK